MSQNNDKECKAPVAGDANDYEKRIDESDNLDSIKSELKMMITKSLQQEKDIKNREEQIRYLKNDIQRRAAENNVLKRKLEGKDPMDNDVSFLVASFDTRL